MPGLFCCHDCGKAENIMVVSYFMAGHKTPSWMGWGQGREKDGERARVAFTLSRTNQAVSGSAPIFPSLPTPHTTHSPPHTRSHL